MIGLRGNFNDFQRKLMKEFTITEKNFSCDFSQSIKTKPYTKFKKDLGKSCQVLHSFLKTEAGRKLNKKKIQKLCIALSICGHSKMKKLNNEHRNKTKSTDVLSFPQFTDWKEAVQFEQLYLGDIVICYDVWAKQAKDHQIPLREEFFHLFFHGFLHLLDYDHERSEIEAKKMFELEDLLVKKAMKLK